MEYSLNLLHRKVNNVISTGRPRYNSFLHDHIYFIKSNLITHLKQTCLNQQRLTVYCWKRNLINNVLITSCF